MKKILVSVALLGFGMLVGCDSGTTPPKKDSGAGAGAHPSASAPMATPKDTK